MNGNPSATVRDQKEKQASFLEVVNIEKLLWATIQHKGISHPEVQDLYRKARSRYEKIIINDYQTVDLQELEYSLWKLHYKHIDEYRKKIKKISASAESTNNLNSHVEGFKSFLSEVAEFYKDLIAKFRRVCEPAMLQKSHYVCHRFLVCLGDVSRYMELCKKPDVQKWAVAATYYLEATTVWPYSGNPQNQLALLATYIGDDFLALYHCIRSLAVKEPFPDAKDNIMLLFEKNKSSKLQSLSTDAHIDFTKPLKRLSSQIKSHSSIDSTNINKLRANEHVPVVKTEIWLLFVRMISFFLVKTSFEDLPHTFASTMKELESLLALNDIELNSSLEPYEPFDSSRKGPYRAIQAVAILIFIIQSLIKGKQDEQISTCTTWAWTCTFSFMGHIIQRCITSNDQENCCALLPAVRVFLEWYVGFLDYAETFGKDAKVFNAKSYFFGALVDLLSGFDVKEHEFYAGKDFEKTPKKNDKEIEEEEVILFKPLTRYNSEPIQTSSDEPDDQTETSEESLRRSSSLISAQNGSNGSNGQHDSSKRGQPYSAGPPSLSGWVLNRESLNLETERKSRGSSKQELAPISEIPTSSLADMSISEAAYIAPVPSAPLLPEDHGILGAPPVSRLPQEPLDFSSGVPGFVDAYRPPVFGLSSSEWLYRYNNNLSLEPGANHHWPVLGNNAPGNLGNFHGYDGGPRFDLIDKWGNPLLTNRMVYFENPFGYPRPNVSGGGGGGGEVRIGQPPGLQQLKEREWQLQADSPFRGHPYMGN
ncbi:putative telomerase activating protein Est1 [Helianthus debilis subsp. tardiflorus]